MLRLFGALCLLAGTTTCRTAIVESPSALCVGSGHISPAGHIDDPVFRAHVAGGAGSRAELAFVYRGPSASSAPLANGELRRQIGLKLRAQDTCNVVYVMWHIEPSPGVFVSVKRNASSSTHGECGAGGYINVQPQQRGAPPAIVRDAPHVLGAEIEGRVLRVTADGAVVWRGGLPPSAFDFDGPAGLRSDNGIFDVKLRVPRSAASP